MDPLVDIRSKWSPQNGAASEKYRWGPEKWNSPLASVPVLDTTGDHGGAPEPKLHCFCWPDEWG